MRRRLDHGRRRLPEEGAEERGHVLGGGQSAVSAAGPPWAPRPPPARGNGGRDAGLRLPLPSDRGCMECRPGPGLQVQPRRIGTQGSPATRPASPGLSRVGWEYLPWVTPPASPFLVPRALEGEGAPGSYSGRRRGGPVCTDGAPRYPPSEQPERSASTCPRVTLRTGTVQVGSREAGPGWGQSAAPDLGDAVPCPRPGPARGRWRLGCEGAALPCWAGFLASPALPGPEPQDELRVTHHHGTHPAWAVGMATGLLAPPGLALLSLGASWLGGGEKLAPCTGAVAGWAVACLFLPPTPTPCLSPKGSTACHCSTCKGLGTQTGGAL